jgi:hypothetical protein
MAKKMKLQRSYTYCTTAALRKELHDPATNRAMRCDIYAELLARRQGREKL